MIRQFTAIVERDGQQYIAYCPGLGLKAIGHSITAAREKLAQSVEVFINTASEDEIKRRQEVYVTQIELVEDDRYVRQADRNVEPECLSVMRQAAMAATGGASDPVVSPVRRRI